MLCLLHSGTHWLEPSLTCVLRRLHCTCCPFPVFFWCSNAATIAPTAYNPVDRSTNATPFRQGSPFCMHISHIRINYFGCGCQHWNNFLWKYRHTRTPESQRYKYSNELSKVNEIWMNNRWTVSMTTIIEYQSSLPYSSKLWCKCYSVGLSIHTEECLLQQTTTQTETYSNHASMLHACHDRVEKLKHKLNHMKSCDMRWTYRR